MPIAHRGPMVKGFSVMKGFRSVIDALRSLIFRTMDDSRWALEEYVIVFNGEIYNYQDIRRELIAIGHSFISSSDTEVILHAISNGARIVSIDLMECGRFVFMIVHKKISFVSRPIRRQPLYYYYDGNTFIFASELKSILRIRSNSASIPKPLISTFIKNILEKISLFQFNFQNWSLPII